MLSVQFTMRLSKHYRSPLQGKARHNRRDDQVWPASAGPEHAESRKQHRKIAEYVIARANPRRTHVGISTAIDPQESK